ncbi:hypothetical protein GHK92_16525 [Nocardioides sp. dk4132]|uniref:hypothetical protein n=1 Tax=unclassified Nocardioides TaxID=2615069 RepID=UPI001296FB38|nr:MULTISPECIES: hypothetical protein [unclassified Nocardioides]MQW77480.1 hypothetical protein [Nocardioides sp. dk4132]
MSEFRPLIEEQARHQIDERIARASSPRVPRLPRRHRLAAGLRRVADRLEN